MPSSSSTSSSSLSLSMLGLSSLGLSSSAKNTVHYRVVILGSGQVGKTSIVRRLLCDNVFEEQHKPTVEELYRNQFRIKDSDLTLNLELLDTSGTHPFPAMRKLAISTGDAFVLVYAIDSQDSFEEVTKLKDQILRQRTPDLPPVVLVGNKSDLQSRRQVRRELAETVIQIDWEMGFLECSAKTNDNTRRIFSELVRQKQTQLRNSSSLKTRQQQLLTIREDSPHRVVNNKRKVALKPQNCILS